MRTTTRTLCCSGCGRHLRSRAPQPERLPAVTTGQPQRVLCGTCVDGGPLALPEPPVALWRAA